MTSFLLMRHGEPDFSGPNKWNAPGWGGDLAPLTNIGEEQVIRQLDKIREFNPEIVISSPTTRTLHSALVLRSALEAPFNVEFELHEWVPDLNFQWRNLIDVQRLQSEYYRLHGEWPAGETRPWETISSVRSRSLAIFRKYLNYQRVLAICHGQLIRSITGLDDIEFAGLVPFELKED